MDKTFKKKKNMSTLTSRKKPLTKEEKRKARNDKRNRNYNIIYAYTKDSTLARQGRDWSDAKIEKEISGIKVPTRIVSTSKKVKIIKSKGRKASKVYSDITPSWDYLQKERKRLKSIADAKERKRQKLKRFYEIAVEHGYTPEEAKQMKQWGYKKFFDIIDNKEVVNKEARKERWSSMARRHKYDDELIKEAERVNLMNGFDVNDAYGWAVVYYWYTIGYEITDWINAIKPDKMRPDIYSVVGVIL